MSAASEERSEPDEGDDLLAAHALQTLTFVTVAGGLLANAARTGRLPERLTPTDIAVMGAATHKVARVVSRDKITDFLRAPFTRREGPGDLNEVNHAPRGRGLRRAIGELVACPFCVGVWIGGGFTVGLAYAPRFTRTVAGTFASLAVADFLHVAYARAASAAD